MNGSPFDTPKRGTTKKVPMQNLTRSYSQFYNLLNSLKAFSAIIYPASGWFKTATKEPPGQMPKPRPAALKVLSPDCVHLRAGAKKDPMRKNPAP